MLCGGPSVRGGGSLPKRFELNVNYGSTTPAFTVSVGFAPPVGAVGPNGALLVMDVGSVSIDAGGLRATHVKVNFVFVHVQYSVSGLLN